MGLTMKERYAVVNELAPRYQRSTKGERVRILDEFTALTGYTRCYASFLLKNYGRRKSCVVDGRRVIAVVGHLSLTKHRRRRTRIYDKAVEEALKSLWAISNGLCGKRLVVFIRQTLPILERFGELSPSDELRSKLLTMSHATADRLLGPTKAKSRLKGRSHTKPGTLLKHHIPIRTFADWNDAMPGFVEVDLVAHDGGIAYGDYIQSLDLTDIATAWTETRAVKNKAQCYVFSALQDITQTIPFPLLGIDSDNGGEFINNQLLRYCEEHRMTFTRSRPYRKNDNCFIEQKNYSVVRKTVGYYRYDQAEQLLLLRTLYQHLRLYTNFFQPSMRLREKVRVGSRVSRRYDPPLTPYHRVLQHPAIAQNIKDQLSTLYGTLNPAELIRSIADLQQQLFHSALRAPKISRIPPGYPKTMHPWRIYTIPSDPVASQQKILHTANRSPNPQVS